MRDQTGPRRARRTSARIIGLVVAVVLLIVGGVMVWNQSRNAHTSVGEPSPAPSSAPATTSTPTPSPAGPTPSSASASAGELAGCAAQPRPITPATLRIDQMKVSTHVLSLGLDSSGAAAAPPKNDPSGVAWFNKGPRPGSARGKVVLSTHTYHLGGALGNELYDSSNKLRKGAVIRLADSSGTTVCYRFDRSTKVTVADYDPDSTVLYDDAGAPMLAIVICWDYNKDTSDWASRIIFYGTPVWAGR
ncbi:class F sortase [Acidipropionibacterium thoenii]|uniref:class F sortase n=1 Tax=Acidipropionibacterium thoenii TaxID=1751 RepID=UPI000418F158|nr:class F sortase [Acidipropionibacterium thoenii]